MANPVLLPSMIQRVEVIKPGGIFDEFVYKIVPFQNDWQWGAVPEFYVHMPEVENVYTSKPKGLRQHQVHIDNGSGYHFCEPCPDVLPRVPDFCLETVVDPRNFLRPHLLPPPGSPAKLIVIIQLLDKPPRQQWALPPGHHAAHLGETYTQPACNVFTRRQLPLDCRADMPPPLPLPFWAYMPPMPPLPPRLVPDHRREKRVLSKVDGIVGTVEGVANPAVESAESKVNSAVDTAEGVVSNNINGVNNVNNANLDNNAAYMRPPPPRPVPDHSNNNIDGVKSTYYVNLLDIAAYRLKLQQPPPPLPSPVAAAAVDTPPLSPDSRYRRVMDVLGLPSPTS